MADQYLPTAELDFDSLKADFIKFLQTQNQYKDFDFEGSNMSTLLDVLTYNTFINAYYLNQVGSESFLDTAQLKESIVSHAKELNYVPRSRTSSRATINISSTGDATAGTKTIDKFTTFTSTVGTNTLTFSTNEDVVAVNDGSGNFIANNVSIFEGNVVTEFFDVTSANTKIVISSANVDIDSLDVVVQTSSTDLTNNEFLKADDLFNLTSSSAVYFVQGYGSDKYEIQFGNNVTGKQLTSGNIVRLRYRDTIGDEGNGAKTFTSADVTITPSTVANSSFGAERESNDDIKFNAPRVFSTQERAVTVEDYKALVKAKFPTVQTLNVIGGEKLNPPQFGTVKLIVKPFDSNIVGDSLSNEIVEFLKTKVSLTTDVQVADPQFIVLDINTSVRYNSTQTTKTADQIKSEVVSKILSFGTTNLSEFDRDFRYSKLVADIDSVDGSILSNNTKVRVVKEIAPVAGATNNFELDFANAVATGSITSTKFTKTVNGVNFEAFLEDNDGKIRIVSESRGAKEVLEFNAGTIDYDTGLLKLDSFTLDNYFARSTEALADRVQIFGQQNTADVLIEQDQIIQIQSLNINVSVLGQTTDD